MAPYKQIATELESGATRQNDPFTKLGQCTRLVGCFCLTEFFFKKHILVSEVQMMVCLLWVPSMRRRLVDVDGQICRVMDLDVAIFLSPSRNKIHHPAWWNCTIPPIHLIIQSKLNRYVHKESIERWSFLGPTPWTPSNSDHQDDINILRIGDSEADLYLCQCYWVGYGSKWYIAWHHCTNTRIKSIIIYTMGFL